MNSEEQYANLELGKTYDFMGYKWTACELINNGKTLVIQSHGVTCGTWPGFKMLKFGGKVDAFYATDIAGEDISAYDDKMQILYDVIKEVEDKSAPYGKGLFLVSAEKAQLPTVIYGASGAGYYCDALVSAGSEGNPNGTHCNAWLGTLGNKENTAWFVNGFANGYIALQDDVVKTIAPAFNIDLSKVVISGDEIVKKTQFVACLASNANPTADSVNINDSFITGVSMKGFTDANDESSSAVISTTNGFDFASMAVATPSDNNISANSNHTSMSAADAKNLFKDFAERLPSDKFYEMSQNNSSIQPDDSAVENRKAQFIIAEQGIAELAGAVTAQSDSSKELTDDDRLVELCKEASQRAASDDSYVPNLVLQICKRFNWDVNERYDDVEEILSQIVSTGLQITSETVSKSDIFERMFCLLTNLNFTDFIHNYTRHPVSADSPKKMDL